MDQLRITTLQCSLQWENPVANRISLEQKIIALAGKTDLIVLPEMFTTGFSMNPVSLAERMDGPTMAWLAQLSQQVDAVITGSLIIEEEGQYFNRMIWMRPDGEKSFYDKRHLFTLAKEHEHYTPGKKQVVVEWKAWKIALQICYDLRFPVWSRNTTGYDLLIYVANWPERRNHAWKSLLMARAIENQAFVVGVNRVGIDGNDLPYSGDTALIDPMGEVLYQVAQVESIATHTIDRSAVTELRRKLAFLKDMDRFTIS